MNNSFYSADELSCLGFKMVGKNVMISKKASFYSPENIIVGNNVRIDDFCILSGKISIGSFVHISAYNALYGRFGIQIHDYSGLSPRCTLFSATDDFSGNYLIGPTVDSKFTNVSGGEIIIEKYCQIGANTVIMPSVTIEEGVAVGALSLVTKALNGWTIYAGVPARKIKPRSKNLLKYIDELNSSINSV